MGSNNESCTVALPIQCNCATFDEIGATARATATQPEGRIGLKALADEAFKRNLERNQRATRKENACNFLPQNNPEKLHELHGFTSGKVAQLREVHATIVDKVAPAIDRPCPLCGGDLNHEGLDGCYHRTGEVPYPEQMIDGLHPCSQCGGEFFYEGSRGGYFCKKCQSLPEGAEPVRVVRGITPRIKKPLRGDDPGYIRGTRGMGTQPARTLEAGLNNPQRGELTSLKNTISPAAVAWLQDHRQELKAAGWPASQLWRRNRSPGIAWSQMWTKSFLKVTLLESNAIEFEFLENGRDVINKAYPMPQRPIKRSAKI